MTQPQPLPLSTINGASLIEYESGRFKIVKNQSFLNTSPIEVEEDGKFHTEDGKFHTIADLVDILFELLDSRHDLQEKYDAWDPSIKYDLKGIFDETIPNAEQHGNNYDPNKTTWIDYEFVEDQRQGVFRMTVRDEGNGFDYRHVVDSEKAARDKSKSYHDYRKDAPKEGTSGRGLFGLLRYCDSVTWNEVGNEITVTKTLTRTDQ